MKVLFATDGTRYSDSAAEAIAKLHLGEGDDIKVICVVDMAVPLAVDVYGGYLPETPDIEKNARANAEEIAASNLQKLKKILENAHVKLSSDVLFGSPDSRIVETAEEDGTDLIVIGSHGYNAWERLLIGSTSNSVAHHAPCSVMIVRSKDA